MRLSISFLLVIFSCYLALAFSQQFISATGCRSSRCDKITRPFCMRNSAGHLRQTFNNCTPCGLGMSYYRGYCPGVAPRSQ